jgi:hypothetical protein
MSERWRLFSPLLVRSAGFPADHVERLRTLDVERSRLALREALDDERVAEAILVSNPAVHDIGLRSYLRHFDPGRRPSKARYLERQLYAYLQRFCTKNETASFFGPIDHGRFDPTREAPMTVDAAADGALQARVSRLAYWAAEALAAVVARDADVRPHVAPRLRPGCRLSGDGVALDGAPARLGPAARRLLERLDGRRPATDVCRTPDEWGLLGRLAGAGIVLLDLQVPTAVFDPLGWVEAWVEALPGGCPGRVRWLPELGWFRAAAASFAPASRERKSAVLRDLEDRFVGVAGVPPRRAPGAIYADRTLVNDDARGHLRRLVIGRPLVERLRAGLEPLLDLSASYAVTVQEVCRERALGLLDGRGAVPLVEFLAGLDGRVDLEDCLADPRVAAFEEHLAALARPPAPGRGPVALDPADLRPLLRDVPAGTMASPDVFLLAPDQASVEAGRCEIVVGEVHAGAQVWSHFLLFHEGLDALERELDCLLPPPRGVVRACLVHRRRQGRTFYLEPPGLSIEVLGRSARPADRVLPVADVEVTAGAGRLGLRSRSLDLPLELHPGEPASVASWLFGPPPVTLPRLRWDDHRPRVLVGDVVAWREAWRVPADELAGAVADGAAAVRGGYGLPERCFARVEGERKPFYVDLASRLSLEHLASRVRDAGRVELTEMLPAPDRWWLRRGGAVHSCEWRMTLVHG